MDNKTFIFHLKKPDSDSLPYGKYFIDNETKELYVSRIEPEKWEKLEVSYARHNILIPVAVVVAAVFGRHIGRYIAHFSGLENTLLLLACVGILFAIFFFFKRTHSKRTNDLVRETGYRVVECDVSEESVYLEEIAKHARNLLIAWGASFVLTCLIGYVVIWAVPILPTSIAIIPVIVFLIPALFFVVLTHTLRHIISARSIIKKRLTILKGKTKF